MQYDLDLPRLNRIEGVEMSFDRPRLLNSTWFDVALIRPRSSVISGTRST